MFYVLINVLLVFLACSNFTTSTPIENKIIGGTPTTIEHYPYQISLILRGSRHICGGSIIASNYIITAAHCTQPFSSRMLSIRAGSTYRNRGGTICSVSRIHVHPSYNKETFDYDISILQLSCNLPLGTPGLEAIKLPTKNEIFKQGAKATVSGWGAQLEGSSYRPEELFAVQVPVLNSENCDRRYKAIKCNITPRMICAGYPKTGGKDACQDDSGGPLTFKGKLIGIVSWGYGCARPNFPGVYTNVANLRQWIHHITNI